jgi:hypothetical protein
MKKYFSAVSLWLSFTTVVAFADPTIIRAAYKWEIQDKEIEHVGGRHVGYR